MRISSLALSVAISVCCAFPAVATPQPTGDAHVSDQPPANHYPQPQPDVSRHEPPDPCRQFHTPRAHARCIARHSAHSATTGRADEIPTESMHQTGQPHPQ